MGRTSSEQMRGSKLKLNSLRIYDFAIEVTELTGTARLNKFNRWMINNLAKALGRIVRSYVEKVATERVGEMMSDFDLMRSLNKMITKRSKGISTQLTNKPSATCACG